MNATEQRINAAAIRLFAERGSLNLTMSELATEAGVARGTLYRNVESIEHLFDRVVSDMAVKMHTAIARTMDLQGDTDPALRLATGLRMQVRIAHDDPAVGRFVIRFGLTNDTLQGLFSGPPMQDIAAGVAARRFDVTDVSKLSIASLLMGTTIGAIWMVLEGHQGWREASSTAAEFVLRAFGITSAEARQISLTELPTLHGA